MAKIGINLATGHIESKEIIVGIDLGTTNSLIAMVHPDSRQAIALKEIDGFSLVPSVVYFDEDNQPHVGSEALTQLLKFPERTIYSAKRLMGKSYQDLNDLGHKLAYKIIESDTEELVKVQVGQQFYTPIELSALILAELKKRAEHVLKATITKAVVTVPAYFNDTQRQATRDAGRLAGLEILRIINEPTAASLAYGMGLKTEDREKLIAVYDLGGGTFDLSILQLANGIFEVLATNGNTWLGGDDMDHAIVKHWEETYQLDSSSSDLRWFAEQAKKHLTNNEQYQAQYSATVKLELTRATFNRLVTPLIEQTLQHCTTALKDAGVDKAAIDDVIMVGGSTRVPLVKEMVSAFFGKAVNDSVNPDEVVALGAAIQADVLAGNNKDVLLLDVTPLSLGIETMGGLMDVLIPRNSKIPTKAGRQYTTHKDGQSGMRITVYQGERDLVADNRKLAEFNLTNIPAMPAGLPKVEVSFLIDADGILKVTAKELRSGVSQSIEVRPQYGLTDEEVERMLMASLDNAKEDMAKRALVEAQTEAQGMIEVTEKFLAKNADYISEEERAATMVQLDSLKAAITAQDKNAIQAATESLNEVSRPYAERVMEMALKDAMKGKKIM